MGATTTQYSPKEMCIMRLLKWSTGVAAFLATIVFAASLSAQTLQVLTAGSSAQFGPFAVAAYALAQEGGATAYHYTVKTSNCSGVTTRSPVSPCDASLYDGRTTGGVSIPNEPGNLWVVWSTNGIWAYLSVDSTVGVRSFEASPRATLALAALSSLPVSSTSNFAYWSDGSADTALTTTVYDALTNSGANTVALTAANTDIRPEDALFATNRSLNELKYGNTTSSDKIGYAIESYFTSTDIAHPIDFALSGDDPLSGDAVTAFVTIPIGAAPIVFLANASSGSVTASATGVTIQNAGILFSGNAASGGTACEDNLLNGLTSTSQQLNPIVREPLSGTMNTTEYSVFYTTINGNSYTNDQENGVNGNNQAPPYSDLNPLAVPCGTSGHRYRAVGTGDEVSAVEATANGIGYAFFSYEALVPSSSLRYLELGVPSSSGAITYVDPLAYTGGPAYSGALPACSSSPSFDCPKPGGYSFINLRNGTYPAWSVYRLITDSTHQTTAQALVTEAESLVDNQVPDFVPFSPVCSLTATGTNDPGLAVYREHFPVTGVTTSANDGPNGPAGLSNPVDCTVVSGSYPYLTLGGQDTTSGGNTEAGGDVGGTIEGPFNKLKLPTVPGPTYTSDPHDN
jgi:hypothetical protein